MLENGINAERQAIPIPSILRATRAHCHVLLQPKLKSQVDWDKMLQDEWFVVPG